LALSLTNASALLWRLETLGCDIGDRWRDLAALWEGHADGKCLVFTDIHAAMAELGSGQEGLVEQRLAAMRETAASGAEASDLYRTVGIPVVEGLTAFHRGAYNHAVELLLQVRFDLWQIGGSYAQRDVVNWTLTEAAVRAGQRDVALSFAHERLGARPRSAPNQHFLRRAEEMARWRAKPMMRGMYRGRNPSGTGSVRNASICHRKGQSCRHHKLQPRQRSPLGASSKFNARLRIAFSRVKDCELSNLKGRFAE
jgi:hypothetical protein